MKSEKTSVIIHRMCINLIIFISLLQLVTDVACDWSNGASLNKPITDRNLTPIIQTHVIRRKCPHMFRLIFPDYTYLNQSTAVNRSPAFRYINIATPKPKISQPTKPPDNQMQLRNGHKGRTCIKCPSLKIIVAPKYQDGVLVEIPKLQSCAGHTLSPNQYAIQTLFSPGFVITLPQGTHSFIGRVRNFKTGEIDKVCKLRYRVEVKRCPKFTPSDTNLRVYCDMGNIWGTKCRFGCRKNGKLTHNRPLYCTDELKWSKELPSCRYATPKNLEMKPFNPVQDCELPLPPSKAKYTCATPERYNRVSQSNDLFVPEGTTCELNCFDGDDINSVEPKKKSTTVLFC